MVSRTALICRRYAAGCTKKAGRNFAAPKQRKRAKRTRKSPKRAKPDAFWVLEGMGTVENRGERMGKPSNRAEGLVSPAGSVRPGRSPLGCRPPRHAVLEWMWESALGERGRGSVARFPTQVRERTVLVWCYGKFSGPKRAKKSGKSPKKREILLTKTDTVPIL